MKNYFLLFGFVLFNSNIYSQTLIWANAHGSTGPDNGQSVVVDKQGNVYSTGYFGESVDFDPGIGVLLLTGNGSTGTDAYIQKLDVNGNLLWAKSFFGSTKDESGEKIAIDKDGNVYVTGYFYNTVDFDPGSGTFNLTSNGQTDIFIVKLSSTGNFIWAKSFGGSRADILDLPYGLVVDGDGNVYSTGNFGGTVDFDPGSSTYNLTATANTEEDIYVQKLNKDGEFVWAYSMGGDNFDTGRSLDIDSDGNLLVAGGFYGTVDFDPGSGTFNLTSNGPDVFIQIVDPDANLISALNIDAYFANQSVFDAQGNILITGTFRGVLDFDPGDGVYNLTSNGFGDIYILKLDKFGDFIWAKSIGTTGDETAYSIARDENSSVYLTGQFNQTMDFDPGTATYELTPNGGNGNMFFLKLNPKGDFIMAQNLGGTDNVNAGNAVVVDNTKNVFITGLFSGSADFDPSSGISNKTAVGSVDIFLLKWSTCQNSTTSNLNISSCTKYTVPSGKKTYTSNGTYKDTIANYLGCDSIITINLTIKQPTTSTISKFDCESYTVPSGERTYTVSGTYKDTIPNSVGCDSIITINLTIGKSTSTINPKSCLNYTVPSGKKTYTASGTFNDTIPNKIGCDSVIIINLTINNKTSSTINPSACESYTVPSGKKTYTASGTYKDTIPNSNGCDSLMTINLTIGEVNVEVTNNANVLTANQSNAQYQWIDCVSNQAIAGQTNQSFSPSKNGQYAVKITQDDCIDTSDCVAITTIGIENLSSDKHLFIYPNPVSNIVNLSLSQTINNATIKLIDINGRIIWVERNKQGNEFSFDLSNISSGVYFLEVADEGIIARVKVIKN